MTRRINAKGHVEPVEVVGERYCLLEAVGLAPGHSSAHVVRVCLGERAEVVGGTALWHCTTVVCFWHSP